MKKVRYTALMTVEFEINEEEEKDLYPNGLNLEALKEEMNGDAIHDFFNGELTSYEIEGAIIEDGKIVAKHKETY